MRKIVAIFLFLLLSTQIMPIEIIGKMLWNQTVSEEEVHPPNAAKKLFDHKRFWYLDYYAAQKSKDLLQKEYVIMDEALFKSHHLEVLIQPPDFLS